MTLTEDGECVSSQQTHIYSQDMDFDQDIDEEREEQDENEGKSKALKHCTKLVLEIKKGKRKGDNALHFQCKYCKQEAYIGPATSGILKHLREKHPKQCPELIREKSNSIKTINRGEGYL